MMWLEIITAALVWITIGYGYSTLHSLRFMAMLAKTEMRTQNFLSVEEFRRVTSECTSTRLLIILGPLGVVIVGLDWIVRHWPECLVLGGNKTKPHQKECACKDCPTRKLPRDNDVDLSELRRKAGIFNNM